MEKKHIWAIGIGVALVAAFIVWGIYDANAPEETPEPLAQDVVAYYYGAECPHCQNVAEFFEANDIESKVDFEKKEVWHNASNSREMTRRAESCGLSPNQVGVPFLFAQGECLIGEVEVMDYFKEKADI